MENRYEINLPIRKIKRNNELKHDRTGNIYTIRMKNETELETLQMIPFNLIGTSFPLHSSIMFHIPLHSSSILTFTYPEYGACTWSVHGGPIGVGNR